MNCGCWRHNVQWTDDFFSGRRYVVQLLTKDAFSGIDFALFSAGAARSLEFAPAAAAAGAIVVDNSSAFRMNRIFPLSYPRLMDRRRSSIVTGGSSPIRTAPPFRWWLPSSRFTTRWASSVSWSPPIRRFPGTGAAAIAELDAQVRATQRGEPLRSEVYPYQIIFNCLPHIDSFLENGYTKEEMKMVNETRKIFGDDTIGITATAVRVPVVYGHSESINIETFDKISADEARALLENGAGIKVIDDPAQLRYPLATEAAGQFETFVGRIREDESIANGLNMWVVSDNILKGAALNTIQIAELFI
jgi:aspartate-semialdehyde dehydrogenase